MKYIIGIIFLLTNVEAGIIPTHQQQIQLKIQQGLVQLQNSNKLLIGNIFNAIWKDPSVSPCTVFSDLGTNAAPLRLAFANFITFINGQGGNIPYVEPAGYTLTNNQDGTVTCSVSQ